MSTEVIERWIPTNLKELREAIDDILEHTKDAEGVDAETIYLAMGIKLVRNTLTDGSATYDVLVRGDDESYA